jgi:hypothetical protein
MPTGKTLVNSDAKVFSQDHFDILIFFPTSYAKVNAILPIHDAILQKKIEIHFC